MAPFGSYIPPMTTPPTTYPWYPQRVDACRRRCCPCQCPCERPQQWGYTTTPQTTYTATIDFTSDEEASSDD